MTKSSSPFYMSTIILKILISLLLPQSCHTISSIPNFPLGTTSFDPATTGFTIMGSAVGDNLGYFVSTAGDVNRDGYADIIIGAHEKLGTRGEAYLIYGGPTSSLPNIALSSSLDSKTTGFTMKGQTSTDRFGRSVSSAGDMNGDGYDDLLIGAAYKNGVQGAIYVVYGGPKSSYSDFDLSVAPLDPKKTGFVITGDVANDYFGGAIRNAGDINNDGYDDIIVGALRKNNNQGAAYVIYGRPTNLFKNINLNTETLDPATNGFKITGKTTQNYFGWSVGPAGDVDNDGYADFIVGAPYYNAYQGAAYVFYGGPKASLPNVLLSSVTLDPLINGFSVFGEIAGGWFGTSVSTAGDINGDGYDDIMIVAAYKSGNQGATYVIYGGPRSSLSNLDLSLTTLNPGKTGFMVTGYAANDFFGWAVGAAGDINGDGYDDMMVGAYGYNGNRGASYVIYGGLKLFNINLATQDLDPEKTGFVISGGTAEDRVGRTVSRAGDINGDGYEDIITSAYGKNTYQGAVYVIHSSCVTTDNTKPCTERVFCDSCDEGFSETNPRCQNCAKNCKEYSGLTTCRACNEAYFLKNSKCQNCPANCKACKSATTCDLCEEGYVFSNSFCVKSSLKAEAKASKAVSSGVTGFGSTLGSPTFAVASLVSKIVQNTRYLDLIVTDELAEIYKTWNTELISWEIPNILSSVEGQFREQPYLFAQYGLDSPFLANFWSTIMNIGIGLCIFLCSVLLKKLFFAKEKSSKGWIYSIVQKILIGSLNFTIVQAYGCLDDILFYFVLDVKTNPFNTFFSWMSLLCSICFIGLGCYLLGFHIWKVKSYQRAKREGSTALETFTEKNKYWEFFYSDFSDSDAWSHSFLAFLVIRSSVSSLIITVIPGVVLTQTGLLVVIDGAILLFMAAKKPLPTMKAKIVQYFFEIITLMVHGCTFMLSIQRNEEDPSESLKSVLSTMIIYLNRILVNGSIGFMFIEIYQAVSEKIREYRKKRRESKIVQNIAAMTEENAVVNTSGIEQSEAIIGLGNNNSSNIHDYQRRRRNNLMNTQSFENANLLGLSDLSQIQNSDNNNNPNIDNNLSFFGIHPIQQRHTQQQWQPLEISHSNINTEVFNGVGIEMNRANANNGDEMISQQSGVVQVLVRPRDIPR